MSTPEPKTAANTPQPPWQQPPPTGGWRTGLLVNNSLVQGKLVEFIPQRGRQVSWYMCGPTVYAPSHMGHARAYITFDVIRRIMEQYFGYEVTAVMNITDIDDKIIVRSREEGREFSEFARFWENDFFQDMKALNVLLPDVVTRVSEYVPEIVAYIQKIIDNGYAYEVNGSVYFNTQRFSACDHHHYGRLEPWAVHDPAKQAEGEGALTDAMTSTSEKRCAADFALWKASKPGEPKWNSPWGEGRPGWHIECSCMASETLPMPIDIHGGGIDLRFPHHDNELAQAEAYFDGQPWVNYFLHSGHLEIQGQKMSKSLKNFITIKDALVDYNFRQIRMLFLLHAWDGSLNFSPESMTSATALERQFAEFFLNVRAALRHAPVATSRQAWTPRDRELKGELDRVRTACHAALCNNFDTKECIRQLQRLCSAVNVYVASSSGLKAPLVLACAHHVQKLFRCFGLAADDTSLTLGSSDGQAGAGAGAAAEETLAPVLNALCAFRDQVRAMGKAQDAVGVLKACDRLRDDLLPELGIRLEDKGHGPCTWKMEDKAVLAQERQRKQREKQDHERKKAEVLAQMRLPAEQLFIHQTDKYSQFDERGIPTHDKMAKEIHPGSRSKLVKMWEKQNKAHQEWRKKQDTC